jgi:hypothetical protein
MFEDVLDALRYAGFTVDGDHSDVSNSTVGVITRDMQGNVIDTGDLEFALQGPISAVVERGGRIIPTLDLTFSTGSVDVNPNRVVSVGPAQPVTYNFTLDTGLNTTSIDGNFLADARFSINAAGSYDLRLQFSDRQTTTIDGRGNNPPIERAVDLGPIDIEGNIIYDVLAVITDPLFEAAGYQNTFELLSGRTFAKREIDARIARLEAMVDAGGALTPDDMAQVAGLSMLSSVLGTEPPDLAFLEGAAAGGAATGPMAASVPEVSTIALFGVAGLVLFVRRPRRAIA